MLVGGLLGQGEAAYCPGQPERQVKVYKVVAYLSDGLCFLDRSSGRWNAESRWDPSSSTIRPCR